MSEWIDPDILRAAVARIKRLYRLGGGAGFPADSFIEDCARDILEMVSADDNGPNIPPSPELRARSSGGEG